MHHVKDAQYFSNNSNLTIFVLKTRETACNRPAINTITIFRQHQKHIQGVEESLKPAQFENCPIFFTKI